MDPDQLKAILEAQNRQFAQLLTIVTEQITQQLQQKYISETGQYNNLVSFEHFNIRKKKFSNYLERFETYLRMRNVTDEIKKAQVLCSSVSSVHYSKLAAFLGPEKAIKELTYDELMKQVQPY